jgi:hypothetical protein
MRKSTEFLGAMLALAFAGQACADTTWILGGSSASSGVTVSGYSNTSGSGASTSLYTIQLQPLGTNTIWYSGGWGINNLDGCSSISCSGDRGDLANSAPEHAIDNNQRYDMALLTFTSSVKLTGVKLGWADTDSDITVLGYTGTGNPASNGKLAGLTYGQLTSNGWLAIGNYSDVGTSTTKAVNAGGTFSSYWLIGAYNPLAAPTGGSVTGSSYDYIKLSAVTGTFAPPPPPPRTVSEPSTVALLGVTLTALIGFGRRKRV